MSDRRSGARPTVSVRVRSLRPRDVPRLRRAPELFDDPVDARAARAYLRDRANVFLLATFEGRDVGFLRATALRQPHTARKQMFLYEIGVLPRFRRRGIARNLVERLVEICRRRGDEEIFVFTSPRNRPAVRLYRATGAVTETAADRMFVYRLRAVRRGNPVGARGAPGRTTRT